MYCYYKVNEYFFQASAEQKNLMIMNTTLQFYLVIDLPMIFILFDCISVVYYQYKTP